MIYDPGPFWKAAPPGLEVDDLAVIPSPGHEAGGPHLDGKAPGEEGAFCRGRRFPGCAHLESWGLLAGTPERPMMVGWGIGAMLERRSGSCARSAEHSPGCIPRLRVLGARPCSGRAGDGSGYHLRPFPPTPLFWLLRGPKAERPPARWPCRLSVVFMRTRVHFLIRLETTPPAQHQPALNTAHLPAGDSAGSCWLSRSRPGVNGDFLLGQQALYRTQKHTGPPRPDFCHRAHSREP